MSTKPKPSRSYPRSEAKISTAPKTRPEPAKSENIPVWAINSLSPEEQIHLQLLEKLGANEWSEQIDLARLKKAYRRLVKHYHPDMAGPEIQEATTQKRSFERFLSLQAAYEFLEQAFAKRLKAAKSAAAVNGRACDNESASAEASQRPNDA